jgi:hypothetical protein
MTKGAGNAMDHGHDGLAAWNGKCAAIAKVVLHVNHQQNILICDLNTHLLRI